MVCCGEGETGESAGKEGGEGEEVGGGGGGEARGYSVVEVVSERRDGEGAEEVGVDVDGFVVEVEEGVEGAGEGGGGGAVA